MLVDANAATSPQLRQLPDIDVTVDSTTSEMERRMADQEKKMEAANILGRTVIGMWVNFMEATIMVKERLLTSLEKR